MATDGEREVMGLMLTTNAEMVAACCAAPRTRHPIGDGRHRRHAHPGVLVDDTLHALVRRARNEGRTWAEIGQVLNVTRQAAFQRFGGGQTPDTGDEPLQPIAEAGPKAVRVLELLLAEHWDELWATFDDRVTRAASVEIFQSALSTAKKTFGEFVAMGTPTAKVRRRLHGRRCAAGL